MFTFVCPTFSTDALWITSILYVCMTRFKASRHGFDSAGMSSLPESTSIIESLRNLFHLARIPNANSIPAAPPPRGVEFQNSASVRKDKAPHQQLQSSPPPGLHSSSCLLLPEPEVLTQKLDGSRLRILSHRVHSRSHELYCQCRTI